jgi:hypothetical protein
MNEPVRVESQFFDDKIGAMANSDGDLGLPEFDEIDREDISVVFMMRRLHFGDCLGVRSRPAEEQIEIFCRNTRAMVNLVIESEKKKAPGPITDFAESVVTSIVLAYVLRRSGCGGDLADAIWARSGEGLRFFLDRGYRFTGLPTVVCELLDARVDGDGLQEGNSVPAGSEIGLGIGAYGAFVSSDGLPAARDFGMAFGIVLDGIILSDMIIGDPSSDVNVDNLADAIKKRASSAIRFVTDQGYLLRNLPEPIIEIIEDNLESSDGAIR